MERKGDWGSNRSRAQKLPSWANDNQKKNGNRLRGALKAFELRESMGPTCWGRILITQNRINPWSTDVRRLREALSYDGAKEQNGDNAQKEKEKGTSKRGVAKRSREVPKGTKSDRVDRGKP